nr:phage tail assembly chaperone [Burkholderia dolosa]
MDFWVAHPVDSVTFEQTGEAWIVEWRVDGVAEPTQVELGELWSQYGAAATEHVLALEQRQKRDGLLLEADALVMKLEDSGQIEQVAAARKYRQALRDVPKQDGFPFEVQWPQPPSTE